MKIVKNIPSLPLLCVPDKIEYYYGCDIDENAIIKTIKYGFAKEIITYNFKNKIENYYGRLIYQKKIDGSILKKRIDEEFYNKEINYNISCDIYSNKGRNFFHFDSYLEICGHQGYFIYAVISIDNYRLVPSAIGNRKLPVTVIDWRILGES